MVTFEAVINGLEPGTHAIHIHEKADCSAEDGTSAGGHWNPTFEDHGKWGDAEGYHKGDIGNFEADSNGTGTTASWSEHLATSSQSQVSKEIALLESQRTYQNYQDHVQNEKLALIGTLVPLMNSANQAMSLKAQSMMLDKMINYYVSGTKTTSSSSSAASSSSG